MTSQDVITFLAKNRFLKGLYKYVIVDNETGIWLDSYDTEEEARNKLDDYPHREDEWEVQLWVYPILENDTHGTPLKIKLEDE